MAAWFGAIKAILPHIGTIVSAAAPVFTQRKPQADQATLQQQITELQNAAAQNTALIKELAEQMRDALAVLQQTALVRENELKRLRRVAWAALGMALGAAVLMLALAMTR